MRNLADALLHPRLALRPARAPQLVERNPLALAAIAAQHVQVLDRHIQLVAARIFQRDRVMLRARHLDRHQPHIAPDAMLLVHHQLAGLQRLQILQEGIRLPLRPAPHQPVTQHVLLGPQLRIGMAEAALQRQHDHRHGLLVGSPQRRLPALHRHQPLRAMLLQQARDPLARPFRIGRQHRLAPRLAGLRQPRDNRLIDRLPAIGGRHPRGGEILRRQPAEIEPVLARQRRRPVRARQLRIPFIPRQIQLARVQRAIHSRPQLRLPLRRSPQRLHPVLMIVGDRLVAPVHRRRHARVRHQQVAVAQPVEQRHQPRLEQRQIMVEPGCPPPLARRLVDGVGGRPRPEPLQPPGAERLDPPLVQQKFRNRQQREPVCLPRRQLRQRVDGADPVHLVPEEIQPIPDALVSRRNHVHQPAPHGKIAGVRHALHPRVTRAQQRLHQLVAPVSDALPHRQRRARHGRLRQQPLRRRAHRRHQQFRALRSLRQRSEAPQPLGHHPLARARPVIGQAIPARQPDRPHIGREEGGRLHHRPPRTLVRRDQHGTMPVQPRRPRKPRHQQRHHAGRRPRQLQRTVAADDRFNGQHQRGTSRM